MAEPGQRRARAIFGACAAVTEHAGRAVNHRLIKALVAASDTHTDARGHRLVRLSLLTVLQSV